MIVSILQNVICKILRRRPCQNFLPGVLCECVLHRAIGLPTGMSHRAAWSQVESSSIDSGPVALSGFCSDPGEGTGREGRGSLGEERGRDPHPFTPP